MRFASSIGFRCLAFMMTQETPSRAVESPPPPALSVLTVGNLMGRGVWSHHTSGFVFIQHIFDTLKWVCVCVRVCACVRFLCCCYLFIDFIRVYVFFFLPELPKN